MVLSRRNGLPPDATRDARLPRERRLVVLSNRAPIRIVREGMEEHIEPTVGGVGSTFLRVLERHGGLWIAWAGGPSASRRLAFPPGAPRFTLSLVELTERAVAQYYHGLCSCALWPLMHSMLSKCRFNSAQWRRYRQVNRAFARHAIAESGPGDALWIQDFHLALTPRMMRAERADLPIGMFWHVPFPPPDLFRVFPWRRELLQGMLGGNLIGFHTRSYAANFIDACERVLGATVDHARGEVRLNSRRTRVGVFPLGIPAGYFEGLAADPHTRERAAEIRRAIGAEAIVLGVDRLDYTKGIVERLLGFERFLELNPGYRGRVALLLIVVPSRTGISDYVLLKREIDEAVGRLIGRFSSEKWVPIRYLYNQFGARELAAYYQASDIALLTPLRDGMNLVAKEFVASHPAGDAVLILSELAGAAEELGEALLVNPYEAEAIAARLKQALEMGPAARAARMRALREKVRANDLERWSANFLEALSTEFELESQPGAEARLQ